MNDINDAIEVERRELIRENTSNSSLTSTNYTDLYRIGVPSEKSSYLPLTAEEDFDKILSEHVV